MDDKHTTGSELTHEEYVEALEEMGLDTTGVEDFEGRLSPESTREIAIAFESFDSILMEASGNVGELVEMHQKLEPRHARSAKRYMAHKRAVERRRKRKKGGKK